MVRRAQPPLKAEPFASPLHDRRVAAWLGLALGVAFTICFVTGLISHLIQQPPSWFVWPARPAGLYRVTQGLHVATGIATVPLLLAKLWAVYPHLWTWPPVRSLAHAVERLSLVPLVAGSLFMLFSGVANITRWYPWKFSFTATHYWVAWITMGAIVAHVGAKASVTRDALRRRSREAPEAPTPARLPVAAEGLTRRGFLATTAAASGVLSLVTLGQTVRPLDRLGLLAPRRPKVGPQGLPVNKSAVGAKVLESARDPGYRLVVEGRVPNKLSFTLDQLRALPQHKATLPISCVEGWSSTADWSGVRVRDLLEMAGARPGVTVRVESLQAKGAYRSSKLNRLHAHDPDTLLALDLFDEPLHIDHGFPVRLIAPNRPGVLQTKWVHRLVVR
ncbi:MAG: molybdopterin-dependent oxidoreductase [Actinomycetota bacterium]|nr:molybdopterin-dependent oxidoreductase [Actinomycetota bacterium]